MEAQIYHLVEIVSEQRAFTKENVQRRQARTDTERDQDEEEEGSGEKEILKLPATK